MTQTQMLEAYEKVGDRDQCLFTEFLPLGYRLTTLSSVDESLREDVIQTKIRLGTLITVMDDLADRPDRFCPETLRIAYRLDPRETIQSDSPEVRLIQSLLNDISEGVSRLPLGEKYYENLLFDLDHFYQANRMAEVLMTRPDSVGTAEYIELSAYNMGLVAAGMIDLMGSNGVTDSEVGRCRDLFRTAQRAARISNVLATEEREVSEGDQTNEIIFRSKRERRTAETIRRELNQEFYECIDRLRRVGRKLETFEIDEYADGIVRLHELHLRMKGRI